MFEIFLYSVYLEKLRVVKKEVFGLKTVGKNRNADKIAELGVS
jgi:hypothetical protein